MIRINCPYCGLRDHSEFRYGGDGSIIYPPVEGDAEDWQQAVFERKNIKGVQWETWHHVLGCRAWLLVERDTLTHDISSVRLAHEGMQSLLSTKP